MNPERWQELDNLFHSALQREPGERAAFLDEACGDDESLRKQVEALLAAHEAAAGFIESPAFEAEARQLAIDEAEENTGLAAGQMLGHFKIIERLGAGGMGEVYLAEDTELARKVALKLLPLYFSKDRERLHRFQQEARTLLALNHPNIVTIHNIGEIDSFYYIASELVEGETLRRCLDKGDLKLSDVLEIAIQTAAALAAAHDKGIVHRDIKPENIMIRRDGYVKVLDFGIAKLSQEFAAADLEAPTIRQVHTAEGTVIGTAPYMSPEQARGLKVDARTDIWSLGVVLYEAMSGRKPFGGDTNQDVISSILDKEPPPLARYAHDVPETLEWIISRALRKERDARYHTASGLLHDLKELRKKLEFEKSFASEPPSRLHEPAANAGPGTSAIAGPTFSAEYLVSRIKDHKLATLIGLLILVAGIVGLAAYLHTRNPDVAIESIAVLPFVNESGNNDVEYLSDGMTESLINSLSQLPHLSVKARSSVFRYKGKEVEPQKVATELSVQAILNGRVVQRGDDLTLYLSLVDARTGNQIWGEQYNRKLINLVALQSEIAQDVSEKLRLRLTSGEQQRLTKRPTQNPEAYQLYLNGLFYDRKKGGEYLRKALDYYNQAIALDPNFALAFAGMSSTYSFLAEAGLLDAKEALSRSKAAAIKALELDETLAEAHWALANIRANEWDWAGAENQYQRAIELNPSLAVAHYDYAYYLACMERYPEALAEIKRAQELDPLNVHFRATEGFILLFARRYDEAIQRLQSVIKTEPDNPVGHNFLGYTYASKGLYPEAIVEYQKFISLEKGSTSGECYLGYAYAMSGKRSEALALLQKLKTTKEYVSPAELAVLYAGLGDKEGALSLLDKAYEAHDLQLRHLNVDPHYDSLRAEPRFQDLVRRAGLP